MRSAVVTLLAAGLIGVGACSSSSDYVTGPSSFGGGAATAANNGRGGGGGGSQQSTAATATWGFGAVGGDQFDGAIYYDQFHAQGELGSISFSGVDGFPSSGGQLLLVHMNSVRNLTVGENADCSSDPSCDADGYARQFTVEWRDDSNVTWRLHYGTSGTILNYGHVVCTNDDVVGDPGCLAAVMDSKEGTYDSSVAVGTLTPRATGPRAYLTRQEGKRKPAPAGEFDVPFSLAVCGTGACTP